MTEFKPLDYDTLQVGEEFVSDTQLITPEDVETYAFAVEDEHPWVSGDSPFGGPWRSSCSRAPEGWILSFPEERSPAPS